MRYTLLVCTILGGIVAYGEAMELKIVQQERILHIERMTE